MTSRQLRFVVVAGALFASGIAFADEAATPGRKPLPQSTSTPTGIAAGQPLQILGVNLDGAEYNHDKPGAQLNRDYVYPTRDEIEYFSSIGMNFVRVPLSWTRMQPSQYGALDRQQLNSLDEIVKYAASRGVKVEIDNHNYGWWDVAAGQGGNKSTVVGGPGGVPGSALADFWSKIAKHYLQSPNIMYGIMNEPVIQTAEQWAPVAQASVNAIREAGATQENPRIRRPIQRGLQLECRIEQRRSRR